MKIFYKTYGQGQALFLLHSGGMSHVEWQPQINFLSQHFFVICPDLPGHGQTLMQGDKLSIKECGEAVLHIMDELKLEQAHCCGSSMGGATALWLAMNYPNRIQKLCLYRVNYYKNKATYEQTNMMAQPKYWEDFGVASVLSKTHMAQGGVDAWKQVIKRVSDALDPNNNERNYSIDDLKHIKNHTLLVCGDRDPLVPINDLIAMYENIPHADLWILPKATHVTAVNTWRAQSFSEELFRFLSRSS